MPIKVKNWDHFQHYKNRRPPWIKLYRELLDDPQWYNLSGDAAKALIMFWLIASENNGDLPASDVLAFRLRVDSNKLDSIISELKHYLDSDMLATCLQDAIPEGERETEKRESREETEDAPQAAGYPEQFEAIWKLYLRKGNKKPAYAQWQKLTESEKDDAVAALNPYFQEWPDFNFRKDFERYLSNRVFEGVLERKATDSLNIPKNTNGNTYGKPTQVLTTMPTDAQYAASENVERDANGIPIF
jgi:hypothetical protein